MDLLSILYKSSPSVNLMQESKRILELKISKSFLTASIYILMSNYPKPDSANY